MLGSGAARRRVLQRPARVSAAAAARWASGGVRARAGCAEQCERPGAGSHGAKWPLTRGTEQGLPRFGFTPLQSNSRRSPEERQAAAAAPPVRSPSPQPCCLAFPHSISCHYSIILLHDTGSHRRAGRGGREGGGERRSGARGTGVGRKGREEEEGRGEGPAGAQSVRLELSRAPASAAAAATAATILPEIALSAPPAKGVSRPAAPIPGAESRVQAPPAQRGESQKQDRIARLRHRHTRVLFASALPPRQVEGWGSGRDGREFRGGSRRRGSPPVLT